MRGRLYARVGESRRLESGFAVLESGEPWCLLPTLPSRMELGADGAQGKLSLLTTQDIILCKRGSQIWRSQTTETEGAQRLESVVISRDRKLGGGGPSLALDCN